MIICKFQGRFGNILLQNIGISILSKRFDMRVHNYLDKEKCGILGCNFHVGSKSFENFVNYYDKDLVGLLKKDTIETGILFDGNFQTKGFVTEFKEDILSHFKFEEEFFENRVFVHVRLSDVSHLNPGINYYRKALKSINFESGFISTDSPEHEIIKKLTDEFGLTVYKNNEVETIKFARKFENIILSKGTFSWWIGFLSKYNRVLYPLDNKPWHGNIFVFEDWQGIEI